MSTRTTTPAGVLAATRRRLWAALETRDEPAATADRPSSTGCSSSPAPTST
ncbi:hypothetical protein [Streptomyces vietnamensis]|uniref:hypothetical protein n=1 Tax=Streptomyces vietnamensis TaxID=362257 RepID=UPI000B3400FD|nr:hypothetical protein [Streptomyces vietnamensis]